MITLVITNRNRDLRIVKNCLDSLQNQLNKDFKLFLVDYGSNELYCSSLKELVKQYSFLNFITYPVSGQLWNKSRAINTVLKTCETPYFFVGDIDMIFSQDFITILHEVKKDDKVIYFQVGFMSKEESLKDTTFENFTTSFLSNDEATGMTLYPTHLLKSINGYDEFYHGWGAEDTDVHIRLKNKGVVVDFYQDKILMKHQWHPKQYRNSTSTEPFHTVLEKINHRYINFNRENNIVQVNTVFGYGHIPKIEDYEALILVSKRIEVTNEVNELNAFLNGIIFNLGSGTYEINFIMHHLEKDFKNKIKKIIGKKYLSFYTLDEVNNSVLMTIVKGFRNYPYHFEYKKNENKIILKIAL